MADGHYSLASRVLLILQAGYFTAKTLFFLFEIDVSAAFRCSPSFWPLALSSAPFFGMGSNVHSDPSLSEQKEGEGMIVPQRMHVL